MVRRRDDATTPLPLPTEAEVVRFLEAHPDFLARHSQLALSLTPPDRWSTDDGVVDLQTYIIAGLRQELDKARAATRHLLKASRSKMTVQARAHKAVLALLSTPSLASLAETVRDDLPALLDVDVAALSFEPAATPLPALAVPGLLSLPTGSVDRILGGAGRDCCLAEDMPGDPVVFGDGAGLVRHAAVVRITPGGPCPSGLLALGARPGRNFPPAQAAELMAFLARVTELCVTRLI